MDEDEDIIAEYVAVRSAQMDPLERLLWSLQRDPENLFFPFLNQVFVIGKTRVDFLLITLNHLQRLGQENYHAEYDCKILKIELRFLRTFVLYAEKLMNPEEDGSLMSFFNRFDSIVPVKALEVFALFLQRRETDYSRIHSLDTSFQEIIDHFKPEIERVLHKNSAQSDQSTMDSLFAFLDSISENLNDLTGWGQDYSVAGEDLIVILECSLRFLRNFICFAVLQCAEEENLRDLLVHTKVLANNAARFSCKWWIYKDNEDFFPEMNIEVFQLLEKFKPSQPQVRGIYINVLKAAKSSGSSQSPMIYVNTLVAFIDSLLDCNRELLSYDSSSSASAVEILGTELKFWRIFLRDQWEKFVNLHEEMRDLVAEFVSEAGIIICSLFSLDVKGGLTEEMDLTLSDFTERAALIKADVANKCLETVIYNFPWTDELGFVDSLLQNLKDSVDNQAVLIDCAKDRIKAITEDLEFFRSFLGDTIEQRSKDEELKAIWTCVLDVLCKIEFVIDSLLVGDHHPDFSQTLFNCITEDIKHIKIKVMQFREKKRYYNTVMDKAKAFERLLPSRSSNPAMNEIVVGLNDEAETIIDRLERGSTELDIVSIVGMPGAGKTTLAKKVYNDPKIRYYFHIRGWGYVSQGYQKRELLLDILNSIVSKSEQLNEVADDDDLAQMLYKELKGRRYFIVLDDAWDNGVWNDLRMCFPDDRNGSRILFTSRYATVALLAKPKSKPHPLRLLTDSESWELLEEKLFSKKGCPPVLYDVGKRIAKNCKGLPLAVVIVAGVLATTEQNSWEEVADNLSSKILTGTNQCMELLELSYEHLPDKLKPCLLYFGSFLQGQEIPIWKLMCLWIAEGFVPKTPQKSLEDIAEEYLMDLASRSLVSISKIRSKGDGIKACRIHDLIHEFCVKKSKESNVLQVLHGYDELSAFDEPRRLCIYSRRKDFSQSMLFAPRLRSLLFFATDGRQPAFPYDVSFVFQNFKLLKVLDLVSIRIGGALPNGLEMLVQLRYLALRGSINFIPPSIVMLCNLETFLLKGLTGEILLPSSIWNMTKLRHLHIDRRAALTFPTNDLESSPVLDNLYSFSTPVLYFEQDMEKLVRKLPNIRKLKCLILESSDSEDIIPILALDSLSQLETLNVFSFGRVLYGFKFQFPVNLKKLTLSKFCLPWNEILTIAELPNLEVLKLLSRAFEGEIWDMTEEEFPKLKFLKLETLNIAQWNASSDHFPRLERLVLQSCRQLVEIPLSFAEIPTLQMIEVRWCSHFVVSSAEQILEEQINSANQDMKILVNCPDWVDELNM